MLNSNRNTQFKNITEGLAFIEGEGDKSLKYYKDEHTKIFKKQINHSIKNLKQYLKYLKY